MIKIVIALLLALIIGLPVVARAFLPWWGTLLVLLLEMVVILSAGPRLIAFWIKRHLLLMFERKSRVLRDASVVVHSVEQVAEMAPAEGREEGSERLHHVKVDFTITPRAGQSEMVFYEPLEMMLVPYDAVVSTDEDPAAADAVSMATNVRVVDDHGQESECEKATGPAHLRIVFAIGPKLAGRMTLRYYFEQFGELTLP